MPIDKEVRIANALEDLPLHDLKQVAESGLPSEDAVIRLGKLGAAPAALPTIFREEHLLDERARNYYVRKIRHVKNIYFLSINDARIEGVSTVHKREAVYSECFRAAVFQNVMASGAANIPEEPLNYAGTPYSYTLRTDEQNVQAIKGTCLLLKNTHSNAWAFWQMDTAARIYFWLAMGKPKDWHFLVDEKIPSYQVEIYKKLGVPPSKIIRLQSQKSYVVERLIIGSPLIIWNGGFSAEYVSVWDKICSSIARGSRMDLKALQEERKGRLLFISRDDVAPHRPIVNIDEVHALLKSRGAEFVIPGTLSVTDKLRAFYGYGCIGGALGSGVNNVVFGGKGGKFLGLWPWYLQDRYIFDVCDSQHRETWLLFADGFITNKQSERMRYKSPFFVDTRALSRVLDEVMEGLVPA